jgi:BMFP domain-containing protein YqiC
MAEKARIENESLAKKISLLEKKIKLISKSKS